MDPKTASILASWGAWQKSANLSLRTISERAGVIRHLLKHAQCGPLDITPDAIIAYVTRDGVSRSSRATYHASIRAYHIWLVRAGHRHDDPTLATPVPKRTQGTPHPVSAVDLRKLLATVNRRRTRMMILLAAFGGLRVHEIAKIRGEDVDLDAGALFVTGKGNKTAVIPLHESVAALALTFPREGYWFPSYQAAGKPIVSRAVSKAIHDTMKRAGVKGKPHHLRHFFGTSLCRNGVDLRTVQELMRHSSLSTTQIYVDVSDAQRRDGIDTLRIA
jgi:integrase/recombinase XerD